MSGGETKFTGRSIASNFVFRVSIPNKPEIIFYSCRLDDVDGSSSEKINNLFVQVEILATASEQDPHTAVRFWLSSTMDKLMDTYQKHQQLYNVVLSYKAYIYPRGGRSRKILDVH